MSYVTMVQTFPSSQTLLKAALERMTIPSFPHFLFEERRDPLTILSLYFSCYTDDA